MVEIVAIAGIVLYLFTQDIFAEPPAAKSAEEQLSESLSKYLSKGIKVKIEKDG
jgi:hypothetical protein